MMSRKPDPTAPGIAKPEQIAIILEREIRTGVVGFGDRLQSENELVRRFSVSRNTVRKSLEDLSSRGLITTRVGIGSFVTYDGKIVDDALGWSRALANAGADVETRILRLEIIRDAALAQELDIEGVKFLALDRARSNSANSRAISIERSRLPLRPELEDVPLNGLRAGSLQETLRAAGIVPDHGEEWVDIEMLSQEDAAILGCAAATPFLRTRRLTRAADHGPIEFVTSLLNPAHFALHLEF